MPEYEAIFMKAYNFASLPVIIEAKTLLEAEAIADEMWDSDPFSIEWCEPEVEYIGADLYKIEEDE